MKPMFARVLLAALMVVTAGAHAGNTSVYKWVDQDGNVHFGDQPTDQAAEEVVVRTSDPASAAANDPAEAQATEAGEDSEACKNARNRLSEYERAPFLYETDAEGKRHILPDAKRQELLDSVRSDAETACGG